MQATESPARLGNQARWKVALMKAAATATPLRSPKVRLLAHRTVRQRQRRRRRLAEHRGDWSRSTPALHGMDVRLARLLGPGGTFLEAGANDGFTQSNTYLLERHHGWRGILVEPIPTLAAEARTSRPGSSVVECALGSPESAGGTATMHYAGLMSIVEGARGDEDADREFIDTAFARGAADSFTVDVPLRTLADVLDEHRVEQLDLLSLDLEGFEPEALKGLGEHRPTRILAEAHDEQALAAITSVLSDDYGDPNPFSEMDYLFELRDSA